MEDNFISKNKLIVMKKGYVANQTSECSNGVLFRKDSNCDVISRVSSHNKLPNLYGSSSFLQSPNRTDDSLNEFFDDVQSKIYNLKTERRVIQEEDIDVKREILYQKETIHHITKLSEYLLKNNSPNSLRIKNNSTIYTTPRNLKQNERRVFQEEYELDEKIIAKKSKFLFISNEIAKIRDYKYTSVIQNEMDDSNVYKLADVQCNRNKSKLININEKKIKNRKTNGGIVCLGNYLLPVKKEKSSFTILNGNNFKRNNQIIDYKKLRNKYVIKIQRWFRTHLPLQRVKNKASTVIQSQWKSYFLRKKLERFFDFYDIIDFMTNIFSDLGKRLFFWNLSKTDLTDEEKLIYNLFKIKVKRLKDEKITVLQKWKKKLVLETLQKNMNMKRMKTKMMKFFNKKEKILIESLFKFWAYLSNRAVESFNIELKGSDNNKSKLIKKTVQYNLDNFIVVGGDSYSLLDEKNYKCKKVLGNKENSLKKNYLFFWKSLSKRTVKFNVDRMIPQISISQYVNPYIIDNLVRILDEKLISYYSNLINSLKTKSNLTLKNIILKIEAVNVLSSKRFILNKWFDLNKLSSEKSLNNDLKEALLKKIFNITHNKDILLSYNKTLTKFTGIIHKERLFLASLSIILKKSILNKLRIKSIDDRNRIIFGSIIKSFIKNETTKFIYKLRIKSFFKWIRMNETSKKKDKYLKEKILKIMRNSEIKVSKYHFSLWLDKISSIKAQEKIHTFTQNLTKYSQSLFFSKLNNILTRELVLTKNEYIFSKFSQLQTVFIKKQINTIIEKVHLLYNTKKSLNKIKSSFLVKTLHKSNSKFKASLIKCKLQIWKILNRKINALKKLFCSKDFKILKSKYVTFIKNVKEKTILKDSTYYRYHKFAFNRISKIINKCIIRDIFLSLQDQSQKARSIQFMLKNISSSVKRKCLERLSNLHLLNKKKKAIKGLVTNQGFNKLFCENLFQNRYLFFKRWQNIIQLETIKRTRVQRKKKLAFTLISNIKNKFLSHLYLKSFLIWKNTVNILKTNESTLNKKNLFNVINEKLKSYSFEVIMLSLTKNKTNLILSRLCSLFIMKNEKMFFFKLNEIYQKKISLTKIVNNLTLKENNYHLKKLEKHFHLLGRLLNNRLIMRKNYEMSLMKANHLLLSNIKKSVFTSFEKFNSRKLFSDICRKTLNKSHKKRIENNLKTYLYKIQQINNQMSIKKLKSSLIFRSLFRLKYDKIKRFYLKRWLENSEKINQVISLFTIKLNRIVYGGLRSFYLRILQREKKNIQYKFINILFSRKLLNLYSNNRRNQIKKYLTKWLNLVKRILFICKVLTRIEFKRFVLVIENIGLWKKRSYNLLKRFKKTDKNVNQFNYLLIREAFLKWKLKDQKIIINSVKNQFLGKISYYFIQKFTSFFTKSKLNFFFSKLKFKKDLSNMLAKLEKMFNMKNYDKFIKSIIERKSVRETKTNVLNGLYMIKKSLIFKKLRKNLQIWLIKSIKTLSSTKLKDKLLRSLFYKVYEANFKTIVQKILHKWSNIIIMNQSNEIVQLRNLNSSLERNESNRACLINKYQIRLLKDIFNLKQRKELHSALYNLYNNVNFVFKLKVCSKLFTKKEGIQTQKMILSFIKFKKNLMFDKQVKSINLIKKSFSNYSKLNKLKRVIFSEEDFLNNLFNLEENNLLPDQLFETNNNTSTLKRNFLVYLIYKQERKSLFLLKNAFKHWGKINAIELYYNILPDNCKRIVNFMKNEGNILELDQITNNMKSISSEDEGLIFYSFSISLLILKLEKFGKKFFFSQASSDTSSNILVSSLLRGESKDDESWIDSVMFIQRFWKKYYQWRILSVYARKLKALDKCFKSVDSNNKEILSLSIIKWKKSSVMNILVQARNTIRKIVSKKMKYVNLRRKLIASQLIQSLLKSYLNLKILKNFFKDFNKSFICHQGSHHLKLYFKRFTFNNISDFSQFNKVIEFKNLNLRRQSQSLFNERRFKRNRLVLKIKQHFAVVSIQERFRMFQRIKQKGNAFLITKSLISFIEEKLAKFKPNIYFKEWFRRSLILKKSEASGLIYKYFRDLYLKVMLKSLLIGLLKKMLLRDFKLIEKRTLYNNKSKRLINRLNKVINVRRSFHSLLRFSFLKKVYMNLTLSEKEIKKRRLERSLKIWKEYYHDQIQKFNPLLEMLCERINNHLYIENQKLFWRRLRNCVDYKLVFINFSYHLFEAENNHILGKICQKLIKLYVFKIFSRIFRMKFVEFIGIIDEYNKKDIIYTEKYIGKRMISNIKFIPKMKKFSFKNTK